MYCFMLHIGIYIYIVQITKRRISPGVCFQHANTRSGRMFGRVCMLKASTGLVCLFAICKIFIYIPNLYNTKQYMYKTKYAVHH